MSASRTFTFTVSGATHDEVMAEADKVARAYWGRHRFHIVEVASNHYNVDAIEATVVTKQDGVAA